MRRISLPPLALLAACTPPPQDAAMRRPSSTPSGTAAASMTPATAADGSIAGQAAQGPIPAPVSAAGVVAPGTPMDAPAAAQGRRTLSTAFVMIGPDGYLTVTSRAGRTLVLRDVAMNRKDYCGVDSSGARYCGSYADVAAARPGGGPTLAASSPSTTGTAEPGRASPRRP